MVAAIRCQFQDSTIPNRRTDLSLPAAGDLRDGAVNSIGPVESNGWKTLRSKAGFVRRVFLIGSVEILA
jgi:hypothetical protein